MEDQLEIIQHRIYKAKLAMPRFLVEHLPDPKTFPLSAWPSYCGAGKGFGDRIIPDTQLGVMLAICCLIHDIDWSGLFKQGWVHCMESNWRLMKNIEALLRANVDYEYYTEKEIVAVARTYFWGVTIGSFRHYKAGAVLTAPVSSPMDHIVVKQKIQRLRDKYTLYLKTEYGGLDVEALS